VRSGNRILLFAAMISVNVRYRVVSVPHSCKSVRNVFDAILGDRERITQRYVVLYRS
jgi:hypothetical protein